MSNAIYKPEENKLVLTGTLTHFLFSTTKYKGDTDLYQVSILTSDLTPEIVDDLLKRYFADTKDKFLPSFIKKAQKDGYKEPIYVNLHSQFEFMTYVEGDGNMPYDFDAVLELGEGLPPLHSDVKLAMRFKPDQVYPAALMITKLRKQDAAEFFM